MNAVKFTINLGLCLLQNTTPSRILRSADGGNGAHEQGWFNTSGSKFKKSILNARDFKIYFVLCLLKDIPEDLPENQIY